MVGEEVEEEDGSGHLSWSKVRALGFGLGPGGGVMLGG